MYQDVTFITICLLILTISSAEDNCSDSYRTVYTECNEEGTERWKVTVSENSSCTPPSPVRVASCDQTCPSGEVLDNFSNCTKCGVGTYSPGDSKIISTLDPKIYPDISFLTSKINQNDKSCPEIRVEDGSVVLPTSYCWNVVNIPFEVVKPGSVSLHYLHTDDRVSVDFYLKDYQSCDGGDAKVTKSGSPLNNWQNIELPVSAKGKYIFQVKSTAFFDTETITSSSVPLESPRLLNITVSGVEPYTKCIACPPGTISSSEGSSECTPCSNNQYAADSSTCSECPEGKYAPAGSAECLDKVTCGVSDFLPVVGECSAGKSTVSVKEIIPNKCQKSIPSETYDCPACQPGSEKKEETCVFCPDGTHNPFGSDQCSPCDPNTISLKGLYHVWWNEIPSSWNVRSPECWIPAGPFLLGRPSHHQPVIAIHFGEVRFSSKVIKSNVVGLFGVKFKLFCPQSCTFLIIKKVTFTKSNVMRQEVTERFDKSTGEGDPQTAHTYVLKNDGQDGDIRMDFSIQLSGSGSYLQLYGVNFTNTIEGGSSFCFPCDGSSCEECAQGMVYEDGKCMECPADSYHMTSGSVLESNYQSQCEKCPAGTMSAPGSTSCYTPCKLMTSSDNEYDITSVGRTLIHDDRVSYPDQFGNRYHYRYLMKLCSSDGDVPFVTCSEDNSDKVSGAICRENVMSSSEGAETITNPIIKGEMLSGMDEKSNGLTLQFSTLHTVTGCDSVTTNVTLICNRDQTSDISLVDNSDNCRLAFEYSGPFGCRLCKESDYKSIASSCEKSSRNITYVKEEEVVCIGGAGLLPVTTEDCVPYQDSLVDSIKRFKVYVGIGVGVMVILIAGFCFLAWYSSSLKHKLDGYSQMNYADDDDNYMGADEGNQQHAWADSGEESDGEENLYTRYQGKSPGNILSDKFGKINETLGIKKYKKFGENDIMEMSSRTGI
ncbi:endosome/lysosome-associated apoptosis and autophagy regulator family member 2-like [Bolinopsis microptera]|uniref:endosome/lysosome-associated apoptosis and autophagy regulator family member 2-like n=1 Tax=Bolinopsis microptera TaxID=2820187 RepID=UPI003078FDF8